jgi:tyrosyl-tRNA synthetase
MSFTEFSYQLVQGYDFYYLWKTKGIKLQMGGSDQWGNIVTGTELIRRKASGEAFALTTPLIKKADGTKFGKTEGGNVWLDRAKTSPYKFYQFWLNASDEDVKNYIRIFTLFSKEEIEKLETEHASAPHLRVLQKALAKDITTRVHSEADVNSAIEASQILFNGSIDDLARLPEQLFLDVFDGLPQFSVSTSEIETGVPIIDLLAEKTQVFPSKGEARKMIQGGGVKLNKAKVEDVQMVVNAANVINKKYILLQRGKNYFLCKLN